MLAGLSVKGIKGWISSYSLVRLNTALICSKKAGVTSCLVTRSAGEGLSESLKVNFKSLIID